MTYQEFVDRYCNGMEPVGWQVFAIEALLDSQPVAIARGRGSGKATFLRWASRYAEDHGLSPVLTLAIGHD